MAKKPMKYGWKPSLPDHRDHRYARIFKELKLPKKADLLQYCPSVYDQKSLGSCTANATALCMEILENVKQLSTHLKPSRLFLYYNSRMIEGTVNEDSGATCRDAIKSAAKYGAPPESTWPYNTSNFKTRPSASIYTTAKAATIDAYERVDSTSLVAIKSAIVSVLPIQIGFSVYDSFESSYVAKTGIVPLPKYSESMLGGHSVALIGYDDQSQRFLCRNSWGQSWGNKGNFTIPYAYLTNARLASDFWVIKVL